MSVGLVRSQKVTLLSGSRQVCLVLILLFGGSVTADEPLSMHRSMLAMLEADVGEVVIRAWLDKASQAPSSPTAEQLIELKSAGASDSLLTHLLAIGVTANNVPAPPQTASPQSAPRVPAPPQSAPIKSPLATPSISQVAPALVDFSTSDPAVEFSFLYSPTFDEGEAEWDLFVYLNGVPLTYVPASNNSLLGGREEPLNFIRRLPPGKHVLRLAQERHHRERGRWRHHARVAEEVLAFELSASRRARIEVEFRQRSLLAFGDRQPLTFSFVQGDLLVEQRDVGGEPEDWPALCEELEADAATRKRPKTPSLKGCVRWDSLWEGLDAPGRTEVRTALAELDYRPVARQQPLDGGP